MNTQNNQSNARRKNRDRETALKSLGLGIKKKEGVCIALWKHFLNEFHHRNQSYTSQVYGRQRNIFGKFLKYKGNSLELNVERRLNSEHDIAG